MVIAGTVGKQRVGFMAASEDLERFVGSAAGRVHACQTHVGRRQRGILLERREELAFRLRDSPLEDVQPVGMVAAELRRQHAQRGDTVVRLQKAGVHLARLTHPERGQHQVGG